MHKQKAGAPIRGSTYLTVPELPFFLGINQNILSEETGGRFIIGLQYRIHHPNKRKKLDGILTKEFE